MTYTEVFEEYRVKKMIYLEMNKSERESKRGKTMKARIYKLDKIIKDFDKSIGSSTRHIKRYSATSDGNYPSPFKVLLMGLLRRFRINTM